MWLTKQRVTDKANKAESDWQRGQSREWLTKQIMTDKAESDWQSRVTYKTERDWQSREWLTTLTKQSVTDKADKAESDLQSTAPWRVPAASAGTGTGQSRTPRSWAANNSTEPSGYKYNTTLLKKEGINKQWEVIALEQLTSHMALNAGPQQQRYESPTITPPGKRWIHRIYKRHQGDIQRMFQDGIYTLHSTHTQRGVKKEGYDFTSCNRAIDILYTTGVIIPMAKLLVRSHVGKLL